MKKIKHFRTILKKLLFPALITPALLCGIMTFESCEKEIFGLDSLSGNASDLANYPVIDVHQHIYKSNFWSGGTSNTGLIAATNYTEHYESLVEEMKANNIVIALAGGPQSAVDYYYEEYPENNNVFWYGAEYMTIGRRNYEETLSSVSDYAAEGKIKVIGELTGIYQGLPLDDTSYQRLYAIADTFSLPVFIHTGIVPIQIYQYWPAYGFERSNPVFLKPMLDSFPNVNFNAAHFGVSNHGDYDFETDMLFMMTDYANLWVDIGAVAWYDAVGTSKTTNFIKKAISMELENKIMYASDEMVWPAAVTVSVEYIKNADFLTVEQKKKILYWNAAEYLKLTDEEVEAHFGR